MLFSITLHLTPLRPSLSLDPKLAILTRLASQQDAGIFPSVPTDTGVTSTHGHTGLVHSVEYSNPSPQACILQLE